ncbi:MAG: hypothetical protein LBC72_03510 [Spirochaetaceae bacterium]|jgi:hypothetical protein|nr:hypothetical protein [Spirochaetaceae bacterium]
MKKSRALFLAFLLAAPPAFAELGFGGQASAWLSESPYFGPALLFSATRRIHLSLDYGFDLLTPYNRHVSVCADYWLFSTRVADFGAGSGRLHLFCGPGVFLNIARAVGGGIRVPIGVEYTIRRMDFFLQVAPSVMFLSTGGGSSDWFTLAVAFGSRWWF